MDERLLRSLLVIAAAVCTGVGVVVAPLGVLAVLFGLAFCWFFLRVPSRLVSVTDWRRDEGSQSRTERWSNAFEAIQERSLVGDGPGVTGARSPARRRTAEVPENQFLQILSELGLVGFALYTTLLLIVPSMGVATLRSERDPERYLLTVGATAAITAFLLEAAVLQIMESRQVQVFYRYAAVLLHFLYTTRERSHATSGLPLAPRFGAAPG